MTNIFSKQRNICRIFLLAPENHELSNVQVDLLKQAMTKVKETVTRLATDHRDSHSTVSKVGKAIDRNFVSDFAATSRDDVFNTSEKLELLNKVICQHYHRHGYKDVANELALVCDHSISVLFGIK